MPALIAVLELSYIAIKLSNFPALRCDILSTFSFDFFKRLLVVLQ